jgi:glutamate/aspartate transport system substrate-binding protein
MSVSLVAHMIPGASCNRRITLLMLTAFCLLVGVLWSVVPASAQQLSGTLKKVRDSGTITIGYRENSLPFSYVVGNGQPIGYSIDLCLAIVDAVREEIENDNLKVAYIPVTSANRMDKLIDGTIDLECGSTTNNLERQKRVAFSPVFFVSGTKLLVKRSSGIKSYLDLRGKTVVVTAGTTNEKALRQISDREKLGIVFVTADDHAASFQKLDTGEAIAFATDDVLLYGLIAQSKHGGDYAVVGDYISYDPYGLMLRKDDPEFAALILRTFQTMASSRDLAQLYDKWFKQRLRGGERLGLTMSAQLESIFGILGQPEQ